MSVDPAPKLTKKQRKGQAFREKKGKGRATRPEPEDIPEVENLDAQAEDDEGLKNLEKSDTRSKKQTDKEKAKPKGKGKEKEKEGELKPTQKKDASSKKRKRSETDEDAGAAVDIDADTPNPNVGVESKAPKSKKRKSKATATDENAEASAEESKKEPENARYILFVGNLKYTTSKEAIEAHFAQCDPPPTIRLLTPKASHSSPAPKSKGCAFLEFTHRNALQQALKLHHSALEGRQINVELTAGGGGKSATRLEKVRGRNRELDVQRTKRQQKESSKPDSPAQPTVVPGRPQRHSSTSGAIDAPAARRTWSVPEAGDEEGTHRGGAKHAKKRGEKKGGRGRKEREWGTGVNAIPVG